MSPFDLVVVPHSKAEREHFTMSTMGVVHVTSGDKEGEFMELGEWMRLQVRRRGLAACLILLDTA